MRVLRAFSGACNCARCIQRPHAYGEPRESVDSALLAIDHADRVSALQAGLPQGLDGLRCGPARSDHVLDQAHALAFLEGPFEAVVRPIALARLADDQEREAR